MTRIVLACLLLTGCLAALCLPSSVCAGDIPNGLRVDLTMREVLNADPPESEIIDTFSATISFNREVTMRVGNATVYLTASTPSAASVKLSYSLYVTGPVPDQRMDEALVNYNAPLVVDDIKGRGKSSYRLLITPHPASEIPDANPLPGDTSGWALIPSTYYQFHVNPRSLAMYHFKTLRNALEYEYEAVRDTFQFTPSGKIDYYFVEGLSRDFVMDSRFDYGVDPSRNRIIARYDHEHSGVDVQATLLLEMYRWWGYAPELVALGASGYNAMADYYAKDVRQNGQKIPLAAMARSIDFKRQPFPASYHHAASFIGWLIHTHGVIAFKEFYSRTTDLSLERALWSIYNKTLEELETDWLGYLDARKFTTAELYLAGKRAAAYHNYTEYYDFLILSAVSADSVPAVVYRELGMAAAHLGRWDESLAHLLRLQSPQGSSPVALALISEALWANGDTAGTEYHLLRLMETDEQDPRPYVLFGDVQMARRRVDSAVVLWQKGLTLTSRPDPSAFEILSRLGDIAYANRAPDSARVLFATALAHARGLFESQTDDPRSLIRMGEALMGLDSLTEALSYLEVAAYLADAPQDLGRISLDIGRAHDLAGHRSDALRAYDYVLSIPSTHHHREAARHYLNRSFRHKD